MARLIVVGGGVVGTMHALFAQRAGWDVVQLEQDPRARKASVRNFGLVWVSGRADGEELAAATRARTLWEEIGREIPGVGFRAHGSLTVALTDQEASVMKAWAAGAKAAARGIQYVDADAVRVRNPAITGDVAGGLWCDRDAIVEPMRATHSIQNWLSTQPRYQLKAGCRAVEMRTGEVVDQTGERHHGDVIVSCPGASPPPGTPVRKVRLQMMQTAPHAARLTTSIADADSLRYYPAYCDADLDGLGAQHEVAAANHMQMLLAQRLDGGLTIGDTHAYGDDQDFAVEEAPYAYLLAKVEHILGPLPPVRRRWAGVYTQCLDGALCWRDQIASGVWVVTGLGGRGMTCSPAVGEETIRMVTT